MQLNTFNLTIWFKALIQVWRLDLPLFIKVLTQANSYYWKIKTKDYLKLLQMFPDNSRNFRSCLAMWQVFVGQAKHRALKAHASVCLGKHILWVESPYLARIIAPCPMRKKVKLPSFQRIRSDLDQPYVAFKSNININPSRVWIYNYSHVYIFRRPFKDPKGYMPNATHGYHL